MARIRTLEVSSDAVRLEIVMSRFPPEGFRTQNRRGVPPVAGSREYEGENQRDPDLGDLYRAVRRRPACL